MPGSIILCFRISFASTHINLSTYQLVPTMVSKTLSDTVLRQCRAKFHFRFPFHRSFSSTHSLARETSPGILLEDKENGYGFVRHNPRPTKPRSAGVTEIRGPYYSAMGKSYFSDVLETVGHHVDGLKFAGGSFSLIPEDKLRELIELAHKHGVYVSTGGWMEHVLTQGADGAVDKYLAKCKDVG